MTIKGTKDFNKHNKGEYDQTMCRYNIHVYMNR